MSEKQIIRPFALAERMAASVENNGMFMGQSYQDKAIPVAMISIVAEGEHTGMPVLYVAGMCPDDVAGLLRGVADDVEHANREREKGGQS